ncbi:uncharacterized protein LY89DRAFT_500033 [Mollisia scopiformis]|uniref:Uncharacterized protein n=1 Tax=Mollisia scopiformis TaxID=149040 RepID=A0A194XEN8_MOLSC|nr:uncharacterized protein LY89DRAFT_500033 [Mollisia scopiformis]KUJ18609.1 hypothetical protein LY89DRAFT_500033 [Mollisia scopiformis]
MVPEQMPDAAMVSEQSRPQHVTRTYQLFSGCYTYKECKKKCDGVYTFHEVSGTRKCSTCIRVGICCDLTEPEWAHDPIQREMYQRQRMALVKLGKRKSRGESESWGAATRDQSVMVGVAGGRQPKVYRSIETPVMTLGGDPE